MAACQRHHRSLHRWPNLRLKYEPLRQALRPPIDLRASTVQLRGCTYVSEATRARSRSRKVHYHTNPTPTPPPPTCQPVLRYVRAWRITSSPPSATDKGLDPNTVATARSPSTNRLRCASTSQFHLTEGWFGLFRSNLSFRNSACNVGLPRTPAGNHC